MAPIFSLVNEINSSKTQWAMKLRLIRAYRVPAYGNPRNTQSLDCVFHDKEGERVHATVNRNLIGKFESTMNEGRVYAVKNFVVTFNRSTCRTTNNRKLILFINETKVVEVFDEEFPSMMYRFKPFNELAIIENLNDAEMFDVIGRVVYNKQKIQHYRGVDKKLMEIILEDEERNLLHCTLWEEYATQMTDYVAIERQEETVLIIQFCKGKIFQDRVDVSTTFNASKLGFNVDCPEVNDFKNRFNGTPVSTVSTLSLEKGSTIADEMSSSSALIKTIEQLTQDGEVGNFWVLARIVSIETFGEWWYLSCRVCKRKLAKVNAEFKCSHCNKTDSNGIPRYKVQVRVQDETDNTIFILWDQYCKDLIGKTVSQILEEDAQNDCKIPEALTAMINQQVMCKVQVKPEQTENYFGAYGVQKLTNDQLLMSKFNSTGSQEGDNISKLHENLNEQTKESSKDVEYTTPLNKSKEFEDCNLKRKLIDEFSATGSDKKKLGMIKKESD